MKRKIGTALGVSALLVAGLLAGIKTGRLPLGVPGEWEWSRINVPPSVLWMLVSAVGVAAYGGYAALVGVTADNVIVTIDPKTGAATEVAKMSVPLTIGDAPVVVDFNPAADRLRYMTGTTNHRVHPDTGEVTVDGSLAFEEGDMHKGEAPNIVAAAYTNSFGKPEKTAMYDIDATIGGLIRQTKPNDGTLAAVGKFGIDGAASNYAFDIQTTSDGTNTAWLVNGKSLYKVDLEKGAATKSGDISGFDGEIRDIAVLPAM